jgi:hypothetical protein
MSAGHWPASRTFDATIAKGKIGAKIKTNVLYYGAKVLNHEEHKDIGDHALNEEVLLDPGGAFHAKISRLRRASHGGFICIY